MIPDSVLVGMSHRRQRVYWAQVLARGGDEAVVVAEDARAGIVGFGSCGPARATTLPYRGEVHTLYVLADFRGLGIGKRLLSGLFGALTKKRYRSALVWVLTDNPARYFYAAMGGTPVAERDEALWGKTLRQTAYGWPYLDEARAPEKRLAAIRCGVDRCGIRTPGGLGARPPGRASAAA